MSTQSPSTASTVGSQLRHAAAVGDRGLVGKLLREGANIEAIVAGGCRLTPLHCAIQAGHSGAATELIARGANIEAKDKWGFTPLHVASENGDWRCTHILLVRGGANIHAVTDDLVTALHLGVKGGCAQVVEMLLKHGANRMAVDVDGVLPVNRLKHKCAEYAAILALLET